MSGARWLIDGMNLIGSRPTGWWRDRERAMRELVAELDAYAQSTGEQVTVVFDSKPFDLPADRSIGVTFASTPGRNAADDEIVRIVERDDAPATLRVVTSDAELVRRVRTHGAEVESTRPFRGRLAGGLGS
jgi:predicted RNA-binding protein with PIN domain